MKQLPRSALLLAAALTLGGCGGEKAAAPKPAPPASYDLSAAKDGTYTAESASEGHMGRGRLTVVIKDHRIVAADFVGLTPDGVIKDKTYGMSDGQIKNEGTYKAAQLAVTAINSYAVQLLETQQPGKVDAIAGATISHDQFLEAAQKVFAEATKP